MRLDGIIGKGLSSRAKWCFVPKETISLDEMRKEVNHGCECAKGEEKYEDGFRMRRSRRRRVFLCLDQPGVQDCNFSFLIFICQAFSGTLGELSPVIKINRNELVKLHQVMRNRLDS